MSDNRKQLEFSKIVIKCFGFLSSYGYMVEEKSSTIIRFKGEVFYINVYHGRQSYSLGVEIGRYKENDIYTMYEILEAIAPAVADEVIVQAVDKVTLEKVVAKLAGLFKKYCLDLVTGNLSLFEQIKDIVNLNRKEYTKEYQFGPIREKANKAWEDKDFAKARELYSSMGSSLTAKEKRRLNYLEKKKT